MGKADGIPPRWFVRLSRSQPNGLIQPTGLMFQVSQEGAVKLPRPPRTRQASHMPVRSLLVFGPGLYPRFCSCARLRSCDSHACSPISPPLFVRRGGTNLRDSIPGIVTVRSLARGYSITQTRSLPSLTRHLRTLGIVKNQPVARLAFAVCPSF